jgi:hypothetical protein
MLPAPVSGAFRMPGIGAEMEDLPVPDGVEGAAFGAT